MFLHLLHFSHLLGLLRFLLFFEEFVTDVEHSSRKLRGANIVHLLVMNKYLGWEALKDPYMLESFVR